ncbi:RNA polymerase sigma factor [Phocaeicola coprophilus]|nr:sigma factor [Phocaeicola coprophilus]
MKKLKKTSDEELLNLYQSNSEENLLNILLQRHMPQIRQNVRSLVCNKEDVEDLCQDIYSRILIKLRQGYYSNGHIQAWIYRIVQNYVYSFYRKKKHEFITQELTDLNIGDTYNPQIQISAESETKRSIFREKDKTKRSKKESAQHSKSRNKSFVMTSVSAL